MTGTHERGELGVFKKDELARLLFSSVSVIENFT